MTAEPRRAATEVQHLHVHLRHIRELDGVRALAVLTVFAAHVGWGPLKGGWIGVGVFFTLSGYLITSILIREWQTRGSIGLRRFYARRLLRLYPALLVMLAICALFAPLFGDGGTAAGYLRTAAATGFYVQDLVLGLTGSAHGMFRHTWSLAVEEQFYLIWPLVLIAALRRGTRSALRWSLAGTVVSWTILAATTRTDGVMAPSTYSLPHTRAGELLLGCALGAWLSMPAGGRFSAAHRETQLTGMAVVQQLSPGLRRAFVPGSLLVLGLLLLTAGEAGLSSWMPVQIMLTSAASAVLILGLATRQVAPVVTDPATRLLGWPPLVRLGTISYGFYLLHFPMLVILERYGPTSSWAVHVALALICTLALAAASHRFVERPFLSLKDRLAA